MKNRYNKILNDIKIVISDKYPDKIDKIILYGSHSHGNAKDYSDYDILIILRGDCNWKIENEIIDLCYDIDLKYNIVTDIKVISNDDLDLPKGKQHYIKNAIQDGIYA